MNKEENNRAYHAERVLTEILHISLQPITVQEAMARSLDVLLTSPSFTLLKKGAIFLVKGGEDTLELMVHRGLPEPLQNSCAKLPFGKCLCGRAAASHEIVFSDHVDERHEITYEGIQPHGHYCVPILSDNCLLGVLNAYVEHGHEETADEKKFLETIAKTLALGIQHKQSEEKVKLHQDELEKQVEIRTARLSEAVAKMKKEITERKRAEESLRESEERFRGAFETAAHGMTIMTPEGTYLKVNSAFCNIVGYSEAELLATNFQSITHPDDLKANLEVKRKFLAGEINSYHMEKRYIHENGNVVWVQLSTSGVKDPAGKIQYLVCQIHDLTEAHKLSEQLVHQASHDALTGLVNRREFEHRMQRVLDTARTWKVEHALCYIDLDEFKVINDTCGHVAGDVLLRQLGELWQVQVRKRDTLARLGGDEFGLLMEHCSLQQAERAANALREAVGQFQFVWEDKSFSISISMGLVPITKDSGSMTDVLKDADAACYTARDAGGNRTHVYHEDDADLAMRRGEMQWVPRINWALKEDRFRLYFQLITPVSGNANKGEHYELLIRMEDEEGNIVPPGGFLPAAERYNLATKIDRWVIDTAFQWLDAHPDALESLNLCAINLSGQSMTDESLFGFVIDRFNKGRVPPTKICFEITETAAIANLSSAILFIKAFKELGCLFALDDFGSGLSSFAYLKTLPVDFLKIDGVFVKGIDNDPTDLAMVKAINEIGQVMGKQTIAEFVENESILEKLREIGVDYAQGYHIGRPQPLEEMTKRT